MNIVKIEDIENAPNKTLNLNFETFLENIDSKEPISADLLIESLGDFIKVSGKVDGIVTLECDLCLEKFEYELNFEIDELFAKDALMEDYSTEVELKEGQFVTDLKGASGIDILDLLYQSVILDFPNKLVCGINCNGGDIFIRDESEPAKEIDPRMSVFKNIEIKK